MPTSRTSAASTSSSTTSRSTSRRPTSTTSSTSQIDGDGLRHDQRRGAADRGLDPRGHRRRTCRRSHESRHVRGRHAPAHGGPRGRTLVPQPVLHDGRERSAAKPTAWTSPSEGVVPAGGDSPEAAMDVLLDAVERLDLRSDASPPSTRDEFEALQRYAPLFLDDAQAELDDGVVSTSSITDRVRRSRAAATPATSAIDGVHRRGHADGEATVSIELRDGCWIVEAPDGETSPTRAQARRGVAGSGRGRRRPAGDRGPRGDGAGGVRRLREPRLDRRREVDGEWYFSPMATGSEQLLARRPSADPRGDRGLQEQLVDATPSELVRRRRSTGRAGAGDARDEEAERPRRRCRDDDPARGVLGRGRRGRRLRRASTISSPPARSTRRRAVVPALPRVRRRRARLGRRLLRAARRRVRRHSSTRPRRASRRSWQLVRSRSSTCRTRCTNPECLEGRNWYSVRPTRRSSTHSTSASSAEPRSARRAGDRMPSRVSSSTAPKSVCTSPGGVDDDEGRLGRDAEAVVDDAGVIADLWERQTVVVDEGLELVVAARPGDTDEVDLARPIVARPPRPRRLPGCKSFNTAPRTTAPGSRPA